jgi:hypothetical protein
MQKQHRRARWLLILPGRRCVACGLLWPCTGEAPHRLGYAQTLATEAAMRDVNVYTYQIQKWDEDDERGRGWIDIGAPKSYTDTVGTPHRWRPWQIACRIIAGAALAGPQWRVTVWRGGKPDTSSAPDAVVQPHELRYCHPDVLLSVKPGTGTFVPDQPVWTEAVPGTGPKPIGRRASGPTPNLPTPRASSRSPDRPGSESTFWSIRAICFAPSAPPSR